jgi:LPXTG-motif cell wall-anchored protein
MKSNKTLLWVGIGSALLIGGGLFWWFRKSAKDKEAAATKEAEDKATQEKEKEIVKKEKVEDNTPTLPSTPFKNKTEGDAFRVWMSSAHPEFRYKNDILGKSGEYNNSFMKEAYSKYGEEYSTYLKTPTKDLTGSALSVNSLMYLRGDKTQIWSYPEFKGEYILGDISKSWLKDKPFGKFISDTGTGWIKFQTFGFVPKCAINARCSGLPELKNVTAYIKNTFVSSKPY